MAVLLDPSRSVRRIGTGATALDKASERRFGSPDGKTIDIGFLNIMPDSALEATERQFLSLLNSAVPDDCSIRVKLFSLPEVPRTDRGKSFLESYRDAKYLLVSDLDALIVTGTEPKAANLKDEPYWKALTNVIDWAEQHTISTIWSCLAVHAAVLYLDGIDRKPVGEKLSGVFDFDLNGTHSLALNLPSKIQFPHSRYNEIPEDALTASGYRVLSKSPKAGVDSFVKQGESLFLFFQGHPEYEAQTLLGEYRRDIGRYLRREREQYPNMPQGYFDGPTAEAMTAFRARALDSRSEELLSEFPAALTDLKLSNSWRPFASAFYRNWLSYITSKKA
jgi:homoserine O-succinyltransferase/O-acetyltransferase